MSTASRIHIKLLVDGSEIEGAVDLPTPSHLKNPPRRALLPVLQQLTDAVVNIAEQRAADAASPISCKKGCDACCRQMVPITPTEAHFLAHLLNALDAPLAARIRDRFQNALAALDSAGLLQKLLHRHLLPPEQLAQLDRHYFSLQLPCPFLEDHACSIHQHRPLACREFLVTSDPLHCTDPGSGRVAQVELGARISHALLATEPWLPLSLVPTFTTENPEPIPTLTPPDD
ncbi:MAG TPA: YkgJ family cysteine cluster protein, partial [Phycisphaerae bacterium]|nr:YkgJ family cysteine cluster protein [Phycisphaerae bacterium]